MENHEHGTLYEKVKITKKDGVATLEGEITLAAIEHFKAQALHEIRKDFKHPGFRPGNVPEEIIRQNISEASLFEESAQDALKHAYPHLIHDHEIVPITYPRVEVKKICIGKSA
jgi:trigger factor